MKIKNISDIKGDKNIALQNITANDITIYSGQETKPEIKEAKKQNADKIANLIQVVGLRLEELEDESINITAEDEFEDIDFKDLINAIEFGNCVLFLGPEIAVDDNGNSLHHEFFKKISSKNRQYNENEGLFMPHSEARLINPAREYYSKQFQNKNTIATNVLKKLAQIPFELIVSLTPDDTMHKIYIDYNIDHQFLYYKEENPNKINYDNKIPILYNALGAASENGRFIYTYKQFNEYIKDDNEKFPFEIEHKIKKEDTTHYLFIGFNFNKWHNKLIMYELNLLPHVDSFAFDADKTEITNREFIKQQFNLTFIDANYKEFTNLLLQKSKKTGLTKSLNQTFVNNILKELETVRVKTVDCEKLEDAKKLENDLQIINDKINRL